MMGTHSPPAGPPAAAAGSLTALARAALALYPPAWRARYGQEVRALLAESGGGVRAAASLAWHAVPAWISPPRQLHDQPARMRASLATVLVAGAMLSGLGLVFAQLTEFQGFRPPGHPIVGWSYAVFDAALGVSALAAAAGGLPLWALMLRRARREHRARDTAYLLLPVIAPAVFLTGLIVVVQFIPHASGVGAGWFAGFAAAGFAAAGAVAAGPALALRRLRPRGAAVRLAAAAAGVAVAALVLAGLASATAAAALVAWARGFAGYHDGVLLGLYLALVAATAVVAAVSAARGTRAALTGPVSPPRF
jgi:hypothetical protein